MVHTRSKTVNSILSSWQMVYENLIFQVGKDFLTPGLSIHKFLRLMRYDLDLSKDQQYAIVAYCWVRGLRCTSDFFEDNGAWRSLEAIHGERCGNRFSLVDTIHPIFYFLQSSLGCSEPCDIGKIRWMDVVRLGWICYRVGVVNETMEEHCKCQFAKYNSFAKKVEHRRQGSLLEGNLEGLVDGLGYSQSQVD